METTKNEVWLGLDVSTNCIGVCLYENDESKYGKILSLTYVEPKIDKKITGIEALFLKRKVFERFMEDKFNGIQPDRVIIEEPLLTSNNTYTVATLIRFNTLIADSIYTKYGIIPEFISSHDARMYSFPELLAVRKIDKKDRIHEAKDIIKAVAKSKICLFGAYKFDIDKKEVMMEHVNQAFPNIEWNLDKKGGLKKTNYDSCDALVCLLGYRRKSKHPEAEGKVTDYKVSDDEKKVDYTVTFAGEEFKQVVFLDNRS